MEFFAGILFAFATIYFVRRFIINDKNISENKVGSIKHRQSHLFELVAPYLNSEQFHVLPDTQAYRHESSSKIRIFLYNNVAYWIRNNALYQADLVNGEIDESTTKVVDTMALDKVQLDEMVFIVQQLTEGMTNDGGSSGL